MPNKCNKCKIIFPDDYNILNGCPFCDGKSFLYLNDTNEKNNKRLINNSSVETKKRNTLESIKILNPGSYELNLDSIFKGKDIIIELKEEGKYAIDLSLMLKNNKKNK